MRYKLIIDPSKDNSLIRYLFKFGVIQKDSTRMFMCSDIFGEQEVQKVPLCYNVHTVLFFGAECVSILHSYSMCD